MKSEEQEQFGQGVLSDFFFRLLKRKSGLLPPQSRKLLSMIGNEKITSLKVVRTPLSKPLTTLLNIASLGAFQRVLKRLGYDDAFHLTLFINGRYSFEKNEVVRLSTTNPIKKGSEVLEVPIPSGFDTTIEQLINKTRERMGDKNFSNYDAKKLNCQHFITNVLQANGLDTPKLLEFINQDAVEIFKGMPKFVEKWGKVLTDIAAVGSRLIEGQGQTKNNNKEKSIINKTTEMKKSMKEEVEGGWIGTALTLGLPLLTNLLSGRGVEVEKKDMKKIEGGFLPLPLMMSLLGSGVDPKTKIKADDLEKVLKLGKEMGESLSKEVDKEMVKEVKKLKGEGVEVDKRKKTTKVKGGEVKTKRQPSKWIKALKAWNDKKGGQYCVPKKGTSDYDEVKSLMDRM